MEIKPIETVYKDYKFRSRLEARWAVFFDSAEIEWKYEPEGYELSTGERYLPDFYLPKEELFVEIKGEMPTKQYLDKLARFALEYGGKVLLAVGIPYEKNSQCKLTFLIDEGKSVTWENVQLYVSSISYSLWFGLDSHEKVNFYENQSILYEATFLGFYIFYVDDEERENHLIDIMFEDMINHTNDCVSTMKKARFEHGENPLQPKNENPIKPTRLLSSFKISNERPRTIEEEFDILWKAYPRKMGRLKAFKTYTQARKRKKVSFETAKKGLEGYINYLRENKVSEKFIKHGSSWFREFGWVDFVTEKDSAELGMIDLKPESLSYYRSERILLAHMLKNRDIFYKVNELLQGKSFIDEEHKEILAHLRVFFEEGHTDTRGFLGFVPDIDLRSVVASLETLANSLKIDITDTELKRHVEIITSFKQV